MIDSQTDQLPKTVNQMLLCTTVQPLKTFNWKKFPLGEGFPTRCGSSRNSPKRRRYGPGQVSGGGHCQFFITGNESCGPATKPHVLAKLAHTIGEICHAETQLTPRKHCNEQRRIAAKDWFLRTSAVPTYIAAPLKGAPIGELIGTSGGF